MYCVPIALLKGSSNALLPAHNQTQRVPALAEASFLEFATNQLHGLIGQHGNEEVAVTTGFFMEVVITFIVKAISKMSHFIGKKIKNALHLNIAGHLALRSEFLFVVIGTQSP